MHLQAGLAHFSPPRQIDAGCLGLKLQINTPVMTPIFRTIRLQQRDHSFRHYLRFPSFANMALRRMFCKRTVFCVSYMLNMEDIKSAIEQLGHTVLNIHNIQQRRTNTPLSLLFIDLKPQDNNKDV
jgi:hypothetical protein